ncbi:MAG: tRNA uridine-5-carboxymethylaminomethyl(34) synthesis enzyme MnmG, partial [Candidatus Sulfotelmatobacter sp.]
KQVRLETMKKLLEGTRLTSQLLEKIVCHSEKRGDEEPAVAGSAADLALSSAIGQTCAQLLKRPEVVIEQLAPILRELDPAFFARAKEKEEISKNPCQSVATLSSEIRNELKSVETEIKYEGYLLQQQRAMDRMKKSEQRSIPGWFDYSSVSGLSREMQEKLTHVQPRTLAQASRIPGVTPAAVSLVHVYIEIQARRREQASAI